MQSDNNQEMFPIVDEQGTITGAATRGECHSGSKLLHPVVHLHVFNSKGELYLQKRPEWKDIQPGKWDTSVGAEVDGVSVGCTGVCVGGVVCWPEEEPFTFSGQVDSSKGLKRL